MEVTVQSLSDVLRAAEITATPEDLAPHFNKAYLEYRKKIEIRGFRKGKAPIDIVKKLYGDMIENDSWVDSGTGTDRTGNCVGLGPPILVHPSRDQKLYILARHSGGDTTETTCDVKVYYRPIRLVI